MTKKQVLSVTDLFDVSPEFVPQPGPSVAAIPAQIHRSRKQRVGEPGLLRHRRPALALNIMRARVRQAAAVVPRVPWVSRIAR